MLIYVGRETVAAVTQRLYDALAPGGWLILAAGDPIIDDYAPLRTVVSNRGVAYRRDSVDAGADDPERMVWTPVELETSDQIENGADSSTRQHARSPGQKRAINADGPRHTAEVSKAIAVPRSAAAEADYREAELVLQRIMQLANVDADQAESVCRDAIAQYPTHADLHCLLSIILLEQGHLAASLEAIKHSLFLDRTLVVGHFTQGSIMRRQGEIDAARRCFRNARDQAKTLPPDVLIRLTDGTSAAEFVRNVEMQLRVLSTSEDTTQ